jgi:hypothetical protein
VAALLTLDPRTVDHAIADGTLPAYVDSSCGSARLWIASVMA